MGWRVGIGLGLAGCCTNSLDPDIPSMDADLLASIEDAVVTDGDWDGTLQLCDPLPFGQEHCRTGFTSEDGSLDEDFLTLVAWNAATTPDPALSWGVSVVEGPVYTCGEFCCYILDAMVVDGEEER